MWLILQDAIENIHLYLIICHSFSHSDAANKGTRAALIKAARGCLLGAIRILNCILYNEKYFLNISIIVSITIAVVASLIFSIATCSNPNYLKWYQKALQHYECRWVCDPKPTQDCKFCNKGKKNSITTYYILYSLVRVSFSKHYNIC